MTTEELQTFLKAAEAFTKDATKTPQKARETLVREGIYRPDGKLAKPYQ